jgi:hypothetical protein
VNRASTDLVNVGRRGYSSAYGDPLRAYGALTQYLARAAKSDPDHKDAVSLYSSYQEAAKTAQKELDRQENVRIEQNRKVAENAKLASEQITARQIEAAMLGNADRDLRDRAPGPAYLEAATALTKGASDGEHYRTAMSIADRARQAIDAQVPAVVAMIDSMPTAHLANKSVRRPVSRDKVGLVEYKSNFDVFNTYKHIPRESETVDVAAFEVTKYLATSEVFRAYCRIATEGFDSYWGTRNASGSTNSCSQDNDRDEGVRYPAKVSEHVMRSFISWLNKHSSHQYRVPTFSEWRYYADMNEHIFPWGDSPNRAVSDYGIKNVGSYPANRFGIFDALGNSSQWVIDTYPNSEQELVRAVGSGTMCKLIGSKPNLAESCLEERANESYSRHAVRLVRVH